MADSERVDFSRFDDLNIATIAVPVRAVRADASPFELLRGLSAFHVVPLVDPARHLVSIVHDIDVLRYGISLNGHLNSNPNRALTLAEKATIGEARRLFSRAEGDDVSLIPILDEDRRYSGYCASRHELLRLFDEIAAKPPRIGGLATPLGVYMTSGVYSGGVGWAGLVTTGAAFAVLVYLLQWLFVIFFSLAVLAWPALANLMTSNSVALFTLQFVFTLLGILTIVRVSPLAGYHAAEHMTINAVEKGLRITEENVGTQPREHQRCGTNLMVMLGGAQLAWISLESIRPYLNVLGEILYLLFWIFLVVFYWRRVGGWIQIHLTTRPPNRRQLLSGMKAGQEILDQYQAKPHPEPGFLRRLWGSGIVQIILSFLVAMFLLEQAQDLIFSLA